jgi:hypothetical protein
MDAMEAVGVVSRICRLGDEVLRRSRSGQLAATMASDQIAELVDCVRNPLDSYSRIRTLADKIGRRNV